MSDQDLFEEDSAAETGQRNGDSEEEEPTEDGEEGDVTGVTSATGVTSVTGGSGRRRIRRPVQLSLLRLQNSDDLVPKKRPCARKSIRWAEGWEAGAASEDDVRRAAEAEGDVMPSNVGLPNLEQIARLLIPTLGDYYSPEENLKDYVRTATPSGRVMKVLPSATWLLARNTDVVKDVGVNIRYSDALGTRKRAPNPGAEERDSVRPKKMQALELPVLDGDEEEDQSQPTAPPPPPRRPPDRKLRTVHSSRSFVVLVDEETGKLARVLVACSVRSLRQKKQWPPAGQKEVGQLTLKSNKIAKTEVTKVEILASVDGAVTSHSIVCCWWPMKEDGSSAADPWDWERVEDSSAGGSGSSGGSKGSSSSAGRTSSSSAGGERGRWPPSDPGAGSSRGTMERSDAECEVWDGECSGDLPPGADIRPLSAGDLRDEVAAAKRDAIAQVRSSGTRLSAKKSFVEFYVAGQWKELNLALDKWREWRRKENGGFLDRGDMLTNVSAPNLRSMIYQYRQAHCEPSQALRGRQLDNLWGPEELIRLAQLRPKSIVVHNLVGAGNGGLPSVVLMHPCAGDLLRSVASVRTPQALRSIPRLDMSFERGKGNSRGVYATTLAVQESRLIKWKTDADGAPVSPFVVVMVWLSESKSTKAFKVSRQNSVWRQSLVGHRNQLALAWTSC